jgi:starch synthase
VKVLFVTVEMSPLAKVGGLADVAGSLPKALAGLGHDVRVVMPLHGIIDRERYGATPWGKPFPVPGIDGETLNAQIWKADVGGVPVYLMDVPEMFDRRQVYGEADDDARWLAFCDAVLAWLPNAGWRPDVLHLNEWHTAFIATRLREAPDRPFAELPRVYTIHNLAIHGGFDDVFAERAGFDARALSSPLAWEPWVSRSGMGQGLLWSDLINTVSPTYAQEILTPEYGAGLDPLLRARTQHLCGILNGIDYDEFNPATDRRIAAQYDAESLDGHVTNKAALQQRVGLAEESRTPLIGMVTRLFFQKGADLATGAIDALLERRSLQFVVLGTGDQVYHDQLNALAERYPGKVAVVLGFDVDLAQQMYAGTDVFLMPSRFEPCGLGQMIALRYGSVPVVRRTGGLADTIREWAGPGGDGNGFLFEQPDVNELAAALSRALDTYERPDEWSRLVHRGMHDDYSWREAARAYVGLYERSLPAPSAADNPARAD